MSSTTAVGSPRQRLREVLLLFIKIGFTGFGGPAATIAMMEDEVVTRRGWLSREQFLDLVGATNLIPGPNATEIAIHVGYLHAGWPGFAVAGAAFIVPAALITLAFAWAYVRYGALPALAPLLAGIKPAVLAVIAFAIWRLGRTAFAHRAGDPVPGGTVAAGTVAAGRAKRWKLAVTALVVLVASLLGANEILALFAGGPLGMLWLRWGALRSTARRPPPALVTFLLPGALVALRQPGIATGAASGATVPVAPTLAAPTLVGLTLFFLKVGAVMYGSGYVLIAFLEGGLVHDYGWLTQQQLLDAVAAGQLTPGPLLSTATFIGYTLLGIPGAIAGTVGVFLPSFLFVAALRDVLPRLRRSPWSSAFLDAVNVSSLALMASVAIKLAAATLTTWPAVVIAVLAGIAALRFRLNSAWLVLGGALLGWLASMLV